MAVRSRHAPPPYQVMKAHPPQTGGSTVGKPVDHAGGDDVSTGVAAPGAGRSTMVTLRLPRGFAVLLVGLFLCVMVLAFWVGSSWGQRRAIEQTQIENTMTALGGRTLPPPRDNMGLTPTPMAPSPSPAPGPLPSPPQTQRNQTQLTPPSSPIPAGPAVVVQGSQRDVRQPGLNYFTANLVGATQDEAGAVVEFLWQEGVEAQAIKLHNRRLFQLIALRGFSREELGSPACKAYERQLQQLGRQWKTMNPRRIDFSGIYPARYDPPRTQSQQVELVITRER